MGKKITEVTELGYQQYLATLEDYKSRLRELMKTRADYGKNEVENYQTGAYDMEAATLISTINDLTETISHLKIIKKEDVEKSVIGLEDIATIQFLDTNEIRQVKLTGGMANIGRDGDIVTITINSPMGKAIYKQKIGEVISYNVGKNQFSIMIISKQSALEKQESQKENGPSNN